MLTCFRNAHLKIKLFIGYLTAFLFFIALCTLVIYPILHSTIEDNIQSQLSNTTQTLSNMIKTTANASIKNYLRAIAEKNREITQYFYQLFQKGLLSEAEAKEKAIAVLLSQRIGKTGYIYCLDDAGAVLFHPFPEVLKFDSTPYAFVQEQLKRKEGYIEYKWKNPGEKILKSKALYMTYFKPWNWIISVSSYREEFFELINIDNFRDQILTIKFGKTGYPFIMDTQGNIIIHPQISGNKYQVKDSTGLEFVKEICAKKTGSIIYTWKNPNEKQYRKKLVMFNHIPEFDWIVISTGYLDEFYTPLYEIRRFLLLISIFFLLCLTLLTFRFTSYITRSIQILIDGFSRAKSENFSVRILKTTDDEFGKLAQYFNLFMEKLEMYNHSLQSEIEERKQTAEELKKHRDHLGELIQTRTSELMIAKEQAESSNIAKSRFLANISHELRTPLNGILGYAQIMILKGGLNSEQEEAISVIYQSGNHLLTLINDILDIAKIEAHTLVLNSSNFSLPVFLHDISKIISTRAAQKGITFSSAPLPELPLFIYGAETRLRQVLLNLLSNAIKFTDRGEVSFKISILPSSDNSEQKIALKFEISDTGIGISPENVKKLFQPFTQVSVDRYKTEGTGLGLSISQSLVKTMGGEIHILSEYGKGSTFWFSLVFPIVNPKDQGNEKADKIVGYKGRRRKVLIADDKDYNRAILCKLLISLDFEIYESENGKEAVEKALHHHPDLILMDLRMPVMTGFEAVQLIRQKPELKEITIFAVSASVYDKDQLQSLLSGCNDFLRKPIIMNELINLIDRHMHLKWIYK